LSSRSQRGGAQKTVDCGPWGTDAGTPPLFGSIGLHLGNPIGDDREAARRGIAAQARRRDFGGSKVVTQQFGKIRDSPVLHSRRDFLR
jgi:hypothetical protein